MERVQITILPDPSAVAASAAAEFIKCGKQAITEADRFTVALAGGSTPKSLYCLLVSPEFRLQIDWQKVFFFFGDERDVPADSADSNYRMANETLFQPLGIADENVFRWRTELNDPTETALRYEKRVREFFRLEKDAFPRFDLALLGMGADGHTASLFPHTKALRESKRIAVATRVEMIGSFRLTLTAPVFNNASNVIFLVTGSSKSNALEGVLEGGFQPGRFPSQLIKPAGGRLQWIIDEAAGTFLKG